MSKRPILALRSVTSHWVRDALRKEGRGGGGGGKGGQGLSNSMQYVTTGFVY